MKDIADAPGFGRGHILYGQTKREADAPASASRSCNVYVGIVDQSLHRPAVMMAME